jgi:hypothetical protein
MMLSALNQGRCASKCALAVLLALVVLFSPLAGAVSAGEAESQKGSGQASEGRTSTGIEVLEGFNRQQEQRRQNGELSDRQKRQIMFALGVPLLLLLLATAGLGVATGVYGKKMFIQHMVLAGLTITLAVAHVIVGLVWFYPF